MRGKHRDIKSVKQQGLERLNAMFDAGKGRSRYMDKKTGRTDKYIYAFTTKQTYIEAWLDFCKTMKDAGFRCSGHSPRTPEEAAGFFQPYIEILKTRPGKCGNERLSAATIRTRACGVAKALGISTAEYDLPVRRSEDIRRSRTATAGDRHFSPVNNRELIVFCRTTGLRNAKELQTIRGTDLVRREDGRQAIRVKGKGGLVREAGLYGSPEEVALVLRKMREAGDAPVWPHVHSNADVHSYRADYAARVYRTFARDPHTLPRARRYCCKNSRRGTWYDREALRIVSKELGHRRVSVVAEHYLYKLDEPET